jgi:hypothetical protein
VSTVVETPPRRPLLRRLFRRGPWEAAAVTAIALGVVMMMQPYFLWLYSESFRVILVGTLAYVVVSKFPD